MTRTRQRWPHEFYGSAVTRLLPVLRWEALPEPMLALVFFRCQDGLLELLVE